MLDEVLDAFGVNPDHDLDIMKKSQSLERITVKVIEGVAKLLKEIKPDMVLVHGDTTTSFAAGLASFYNGIPVGHVEAGLRTYDKFAPYPEEFNRQAVSSLADLHFAPTPLARKNLLDEHVDRAKIFVTGNTVIDAVRIITNKRDGKIKSWKVAPYKKIILVTAHRRENHAVLREMFSAIKKLSAEFSDLRIIYPVHPNPIVKEAAAEILRAAKNVDLIAPLDISNFYSLMRESDIILTDSGGIQEEAPSLGKPVLVMRDKTERPEGIKAGTLKLVGTSSLKIYRETKKLLTDNMEYKKMARAKNPYGDGHASEKIAEAIKSRSTGVLK
jgi:UDP-N-acetylglucosamine 2-epimerase (non-hydrolysing)